MSTSPIAGLGLALLLTTACSPSPPTFEVADSAGVALVTTSSRAKAPVTLRLAKAALIDVGGAPRGWRSATLRSEKRSRGVRLSSGRLVAIDDSVVVLFDTVEYRTRRIGGYGGGPGQFLALQSICVSPGDTLVVFDVAARRMTVMDSAGKIVRMVSLPNAVLLDDACLDGGKVMATTVGQLDGHRTVAQRLRMIHPDGRIDSLGDMVGRQYFPTGERLVLTVATGKTLVVGDAALNRIAIYSIDSTLVLRRIIASADSLKSKSSNTESAPEWVQDLARGGHFSGLLPGPDGTIWVRDAADKFLASSGWTQLDSTGRIVERLELPIALDPLRFERGTVLVRYKDDDLAPHLAIYPIERLEFR